MAGLLTNESAQVALATLRNINKNLASVQQQISTGKSVANARDNAAIFAVATTIESDAESFKAISQSLSLGNSTVNVARVASEQITTILRDIKDLTVAAQEENVDRATIQKDVSRLIDQVNSIVGAAQFNGLNLVAGKGDVDFLSSIDRSAGTVTPSTIEVSRQNLQTNVGTLGTGPAVGALNIATGGEVTGSAASGSINAGIAGVAADPAVGLLTLTGAARASDATLTLTGPNQANTNATVTFSDPGATVLGSGNTVSLTIGGQTYTATEGQNGVTTLDNALDRISTLITANTPALPSGVTVSFDNANNIFTVTNANLSTVGLSAGGTQSAATTIGGDFGGGNINAAAPAGRLLSGDRVTVVVGSQSFSADYSVGNSITNIDQALANIATQINNAAAAPGSLVSNVAATAGNGATNTATLRLVNDRNEALAFSVAVTNGANPAVGPFSSAVAGAYSNGSVNAKSASNLNTGEQVEVTVGGNTFTVAANGTTITNIDQAVAQIATNIGSTINGVSVAAGSGTSNSTTLELTNRNGSSVAFSARVLTAGNNAINTFTTTLTGEQAGGATVNAGVLAVAADPTEASFTLSNATALVNGDGFRLSIAGRNLDFVFDGATTVSNAASSIVNQINQAKITGVTATLGNNGSFSVANATASSVAFTTSTASDGTAAGGLSVLNGFSVDPTGTGAEKDAALTARLADIETAIQASTGAAATFGSAQKRFDIQEDFVTSLIDSLRLGVGALTEADIEEASARLQSLQVQQQLGIQALSIANQQPQAILALFR